MTIVAILDEHRAALTLVKKRESDGYFTAAGAKDSIKSTGELKNWQARIEQAVVAAAAEAERVRAREARALAELATPKGNTEAQLLDELRGARAWNRLRAVLDSRTDVAAATYFEAQVAELAPDALRVALDEAPAYFEARGAYYSPEAVTSALEAIAPDYAQARRATEAADNALADVETMAHITAQHVDGMTFESARVDVQVRGDILRETAA